MVSAARFAVAGEELAAAVGVHMERWVLVHSRWALVAGIAVVDAAGAALDVHVVLRVLGHSRVRVLVRSRWAFVVDIVFGAGIAVDTAVDGAGMAAVEAYIVVGGFGVVVGCAGMAVAVGIGHSQLPGGSTWLDYTDR
jgi:hypothetical protein